VPQPNKHEEKEWWHPECTRIAAEEMLKRIPTDGAFLVRPSERESNCYAISFRYVFLKRFFSCFFFITFCSFRFCIIKDNTSPSYTNVYISNQMLLS